ncbi:MAG: hypothetical protein MHM6MM_004449 [Cercozoa sp. M6MM]
MLLVLLLGLIVGISALRLPGQVQLPADADYRPLRLYLNGVHEIVPLADGSFYTDLTEGVHVLSVAHPSFRFDPVRLQVQDGQVRAFGYNTQSRLSTRPFKVKPLGQQVYEPPKTPFSIMSLLGNKMMIIALVGVGASFFMPRMMKNLQEEQRRLAEEQRAGNRN